MLRRRINAFTVRFRFQAREIREPHRIVLEKLWNLATIAAMPLELSDQQYNPMLGRFINRDPFEGFAQLPMTLNRFVYALDNPASLVERNGIVQER